MMAHLTAEAAAATAADGGGAGFVSTNDAVVVFVWMLTRRLRGESLGGGGGGGGKGWRRGWMGRVCNSHASAEGERGGEGEGGRAMSSAGGGDGVNHGVMYQSIDLRGMGIHGMDPNLFGNGSTQIVTLMPPLPPAAAAAGGGGGGGGDQAAAGAMARAVRASVNEWRTTAKHEECRGSLLAQASADIATQLKAAVAFMVLNDAVYTSWPFPLWDVRFSHEVTDRPAWFWGRVG